MPNLTGFEPSWLFLAGGFGLFGFQTYDAIDGKHARRTGTASPLGELFDHGFDSMISTVAPATFVAITQLGTSPMFLILLVMGSIPLYCQYWEESYTHTIYWGVWSNAIEGTLLVVGLYLGAWWNTPAYWLTPVNLGFVVVPFNYLFAYLYIVATIPAILDNFKKVYRVRKSVQAMKEPLGKLIAYTLFHVLFFLWILVIAPSLFQKYAWHVISLYALVNANLTMWLMISKNAREGFPVFFGILIPLVFPVVDHYFSVFTGSPSFINQEMLLFVYLAIATTWHFSDFIRLILSFSSFLGLPCLTMPKHAKIH